MGKCRSSNKKDDTGIQPAAAAEQARTVTSANATRSGSRSVHLKHSHNHQSCSAHSITKLNLAVSAGNPVLKYSKNSMPLTSPSPFRSISATSCVFFYSDQSWCFWPSCLLTCEMDKSEESRIITLSRIGSPDFSISSLNDEHLNWSNKASSSAARAASTCSCALS